MATTHADAVRELIERGVELVRNFEIFHVLAETRIRNHPGYVNHQDLFEATVNAHLQPIFIIAYLLYDKRRGVKSIPNMLRHFENTNPSDMARIRGDIQANAVTFNAIADIRGSIFAHRNELLTPQEILRRAKLSKGFMSSTVRMAARHLSVLGGLARVGSRRDLRSEFSRRGRYAKEDTELVIKALIKNAPL